MSPQRRAIEGLKLRHCLWHAAGQHLCGLDQLVQHSARYEFALMNRWNHTITITHDQDEDENRQLVHFLDVWLDLKSSALQYRTYCKPQCLHMYTPYNLFHPSSVKSRSWSECTKWSDGGPLLSSRSAVVLLPLLPLGAHAAERHKRAHCMCRPLQRYNDLVRFHLSLRRY